MIDVTFTKVYYECWDERKVHPHRYNSFWGFIRHYPLCSSITPPEDELQHQLRQFVTKSPCPDKAFYFQTFIRPVYFKYTNVSKLRLISPAAPLQQLQSLSYGHHMIGLIRALNKERHLKYRQVSKNYYPV